MSGSAQYINPVTAARGSRAVRCNITWAVERLPLFNVLSSSSRLQTVLLIERAKWISAYCLPVSVCSVTTMGPRRNVYGKRNTNCFMTKTVYRFIIVLILGNLVIHTMIPRTIWFKISFSSFI